MQTTATASFYPLLKNDFGFFCFNLFLFLITASIRYYAAISWPIHCVSLFLFHTDVKSSFRAWLTWSLSCGVPFGTPLLHPRKLTAPPRGQAVLLSPVHLSLWWPVFCPHLRKAPPHLAPCVNDPSLVIWWLHRGLPPDTIILTYCLLFFSSKTRTSSDNFIFSSGTLFKCLPDM